MRENISNTFLLLTCSRFKYFCYATYTDIYVIIGYSEYYIMLEIN